MTALISIEGVLRKPNKDPIPEGFKLLRTLVVSYRVVLSTDSNEAEINHWLKTNYLFDYSDVMDSSHFYAGQDYKSRHLELARTQGKVEIYVDADPDACAAALAQGIPTLLFSSPKYFPSSREVRPWDTITKEQERQKQLIAEKYAKLNSNDSEGFRFE